MKKGFRAMKQAAFAFIFFLTLSAFGEGMATHSSKFKEIAFVSAKAARKSAAKSVGEIKMKEKIICEFLEKNGDVKIYDCFRFVCEDDAILKLYYIRKMKDFALDWLMNKADNPEYKIFGSRLHFPMEKIPEVVKTMTDAFYLCDPWEPDKDGFVVKLEDSYFSASVVFADWMPSPYFMDSFFIAQRNFREDERQIHETINLEWDMETMSKVPLKGTRVMPKSLAALIKGLRDFYNEWQKAHSECKRME